MRLLIAEDDVDLNKVMVKKLQAEGFIVDSCFNGMDALAYLTGADYDAAILDIMMPVMDGLETVKKLRENEKSTPVIFLTAKDTIADKVEGLNIGANDYVVKPFSFDELIARIHAVTRTVRGNVSDTIQLADLSLNTSTHEVYRDGKMILLTAREYNLLEYMMINKGRILSREKILNYVWGYDYYGRENIIDVYMNYLRKKIDQDFSPKLIHTVRGAGYVMRVED
ncbi:MAG: response regulator transcription factor [Lachnospiraceae bacterium]|nr:response regulator transcription factor [Lachnospiraceae bacterium]